jgi:hypothetical protein
MNKTSHIDLTTLSENPNWVIFTAQNPTNYDFVTKKINSDLHEELIEELNNSPYRHTFIETFGYFTRKPELGVLVWSNEPVTRDNAANIAKRYNQECVLTRDGLVYQDRSCHPLIDISYPLTEPEDNYTLIGSIYIQANIDFETTIR